MSETNQVDNVTFVGGKAIEQHEAAESDLPSDERSEAIKAVKKAMAKQAAEESADPDIEEKVKDPTGVEKLRRAEKAKAKESPEEDDAGSERGPDGRFLPKEGKSAKEGKEPSKAKPEASKADSEEEPELDVSKGSVRELMKAREKIANLKREAKAKEEAAKYKDGFNQDVDQLRSAIQQLEARERAQEEREKRWKELEADPARTMRELGQDPEEFILRLAKEGTPEGQMARKMRELDEAMAKIKNWEKTQQETRQQAMQRQREALMEQARSRAVVDFTNLAKSEGKYEHSKAVFGRFNDKFLVAMGDIVAEEFRDLTGRDPQNVGEILDYIEDELAEGLNEWYSNKVKGSQKAKTTETELKAPPAKSKGKSVGPDMSGERRSLAPKSIKDLDEDDRLDVARQAVKAAFGK